MGEGNAFQRVLVGPASERLLAVQPGQIILDVACGNGVMSLPPTTTSTGRSTCCSAPASPRALCSTVWRSRPSVPRTGADGP